MGNISTPYPRIALIGFRGVGKSTVGKILAKKMRIRYVSLDEYIEKKTKSTITDLVAEKGWKEFRNKESEALRFFSNRPGVLLDTGGGIMEDENGELSEKKFQILKNCYFCVYLYMQDHLLLQRLSDAQPSAHRPALVADDLQEVLNKRKPWYEKLAQMAIGIDRMTPGEIAHRIIRKVKYIKL
ncbi:MAG: shikimate kinase [Leptospirales bacterium]